MLMLVEETAGSELSLSSREKDVTKVWNFRSADPSRVQPRSAFTVDTMSVRCDRAIKVVLRLACKKTVFCWQQCQIQKKKV